MTKQKWIIAPMTGEILPRVRNLKMKSATADSPIYSRGFVIGGKRLGASKPTSEKE